MKLSLTKTASALAALAFGLTVQAAFAQGTEPGQETLSKELMEDTVLCMKNVTDEPVVALVWEGFFSYAGNTRPLTILGGKTTCLRYRDAIRIEPDFHFVADGKFRPIYFRGICKRLKNGNARFYLFERTPRGGKRCVWDKSRSDDSIRRLVKGAKPITR
jgi:hypothetical protein